MKRTRKNMLMHFRSCSTLSDTNSRWRLFYAILCPANLLCAVVNAVVYGEWWLMTIGLVAALMAWREWRTTYFVPRVASRPECNFPRLLK